MMEHSTERQNMTQMDSIHRTNRKVTYKTSSGVYKQVSLNGYQQSWNPNDGRVVCGQEDIVSCGQTWMSISYIIPNPRNSGLKAYIPAGTLDISLTVYLPKYSKIATVSRFRQVPTGNYLGVGYGDLKAEPDSGAAGPGALSARDHITTNRGGHSRIIERAVNPPLVDGGWLYTKLLYYDGSRPQSYNISMVVDLDIYRGWYTGAAFDAYGDPTGGIAPPPPPPPPDPPPPPPTDERQKALDALEVARGYILTH